MCEAVLCLLFSVSPLEQRGAASQLANAAPHSHEQCISGERRSQNVRAASRKANTAPDQAEQFFAKADAAHKY